MKLQFMLCIDLNCDMGEGYGNYSLGNDGELLNYITSANIACGLHAGDPAVMQHTVQAALRKNVAIGAHPGLPDLQGFGRRNMAVSPKEAYQMTVYQIGALAGFVKIGGGRLNHVKPHGALYNMACESLPLAEAVARAVADFDESLVLYGLTGSQLIVAGKKMGLKVANEAFADRTYQANGLLTPRSQPGAMIEDPGESFKQVLSMVKKNQADTICIHGDGMHAVSFAKTIRNGLESAGITVQAY